MSNYSQTTFFTPKDSLPAGNPSKTIFGAAYDVEFGNISTAIATKYDSSSAVGVLAFIANANTFTAVQSFTAAVPSSATTGVISVGALTFSDSGNVAVFESSTAGYNQIELQNASNATNASASFIADNNAATATTNYAEFGINSSTFTGSGSFNAAGYAYLNSASTDLVITTQGANSIHFQVNNAAVTTDTAVVNATGHWTFNAPSGGTGATIAAVGSAGYNAITATGSSTSGQSYGLKVAGGTTSADYALSVVNQANTQNYLQVYGDGGVVLGSATGGDQGLGSINASAVYVNGVALSGGVTITTVFKAATTSRNTTTTLANDPDLAVTISATGTYEVYCQLFFYGTTTGTQGFKYLLTYSATAGAADFYSAVGALNSSAIAYAGNLFVGGIASATGTMSTGSATPDHLLLSGTINCTATGTLNLQWAQATSSANNTNLSAGSRMSVRKIG
jgi:hypothetical protein